MKKRDKTCQYKDLESDSSEYFFQNIDLEFLVHELKDPLSVIESNMRMLLKRADKYGPYSPKLEKVLHRSLTNAVKASEMLYGMLEIGRSEAGHIVPSEFRTDMLILHTINDTLELTSDYSCRDLNGCTNDEAIQQFAAYGLVLDLSDSLEQTTIQHDVVKIRQILGNLIKNALQYRKKTIHIKTDIVEDILVVDVMDDGPGIDPAHYDLIFKRYARARDRSSTPSPNNLIRKKHGLGLAASQIMARYMGGDIIIKTNDECGACFELRMPMIYTQKEI
ncbi:MAG: sensor histidine kinase [Desulfatirhabdiaceae bacterium]